MRKITSLLMLFCMCVGMAFAQTLPATNKAFKVENNRGALAINNDGTALIGTPNVAIADVAQKNFAFIQHDGKVYLYSVWASKFVNKDCSLTNSLPVDAITVENVADGKFFFKFDDAHNVNLGGSGQIAVNDWSIKDAGNQFTLVENGDFDPTAALAILDNSYTITYEFVYNDKVVATQTTKINRGANYPAFNALPWGIVADVPAGAPTDNETVQITCDVDTSVLPFVAAEDYNSIEHWYYMKIRDDGPTYLYYNSSVNYIKADKSDVDQDNKDIYSWAFVGNPFDGFSIVNKAAGETMVLSSPKAPTGNANADELARMVVKADATGNTVWTILAPTHNNSATGAFYIQHPTNTGYAFNRQGFGGGNALCYWTGRDTGSALQVVERPIGLDAELKALIADYNAWKTARTIGTGLGEYSCNNDVLGTAEAELQAAQTTDEARTAIAKCKATYVINQPSVGKFYRIISMNANDAAKKDKFWQVNETGDGMELQKGANYSKLRSIVYYTPEKTFVSYAKGLYINRYQAPAAQNAEPLAWFIEENESVAGTYALYRTEVKEDNSKQKDVYCLSDWYGLTYGQEDANAAWKIEEVTWLPIPVNVEAGWTSIYSPVELNPMYGGKARFKVYTVSEIKGDYASLEKQTAVPANQGVVLELTENGKSAMENGCVFLEIQENNSEATSALLGSYADTFIEGEAYVLSNKEGIGFYKTLLNKTATGETVEEGTHFLNNGFKAYLPMTATQGANMLRFNFGGETTAIDAVEVENANAPIYDLSGRRVLSTVKGGIYIQNGKKFIVK